MPKVYAEIEITEEQLRQLLVGTSPASPADAPAQAAVSPVSPAPDAQATSSANPLEELKAAARAAIKGGNREFVTSVFVDVGMADKSLSLPKMMAAVGDDTYQAVLEALKAGPPKFEGSGIKASDVADKIRAVAKTCGRPVAKEALAAGGFELLTDLKGASPNQLDVVAKVADDFLAAKEAEAETEEDDFM